MTTPYPPTPQPTPQPTQHGQHVAYQGTPATTQPPGYKREEQIAVNKDNLAERIDTLSSQTQTASIDPKALQPEREILGLLEGGSLEVSNALPDYKYKWVQCKTPKDNPMMKPRETLTKRIRVRSPGGQEQLVHCWEVVSGDMPEARELKSAENTRILGDTMLFRCRKDIYAIIELEERKVNRRRMAYADAGLEEKAEEVRKKVGAPLVFGGVETFDKHSSDSNINATLNQLRRDEQIRSGNIPGLEIRR